MYKIIKSVLTIYTFKVIATYTCIHMDMYTVVGYKEHAQGVLISSSPSVNIAYNIS